MIEKYNLGEINMTKILYNDENKKNIINSLNICIDELNRINNIFYNIEIPYDFKRKDILNNIKENIKTNKEQLLKYKDSINLYMEELNKKELDILSSINKIEEIKIDKF